MGTVLYNMRKSANCQVLLEHLQPSEFQELNTLLNHEINNAYKEGFEDCLKFVNKRAAPNRLVCPYFAHEIP